MKGMLCGVMMIVALVGCVSMSVQPPKDDATYTHDRAFCHADAQTFAMMAHDPSYRRSMFAARMRSCMHARGWPVKDESP
jgi:hypothetical protein